MSVSVVPEGNMSKLFEDSSLSEAYLKFRSYPPQPLIDTVVRYVQEKTSESLDLAVDVGCGQGQAARMLSPHFEHVLGVDGSDSQISLAKEISHPSNVTYSVASAENLPLPDESVQLVMSVEACHWFDLPSFFKEVDRVLVPGGVVALAGYVTYRFIRKDTIIILKDAFSEVVFGESTKYWNSMNYNPKYLRNKYADIILPYEETYRIQDDPTFITSQDVTVADLASFVASLSTTTIYRKENGEEAARKYIQSIQNRWMQKFGASGEPGQVDFTVEVPYFLAMARKPLN